MDKRKISVHEVIVTLFAASVLLAIYLKILFF